MKPVLRSAQRDEADLPGRGQHGPPDLDVDGQLYDAEIVASSLVGENLSNYMKRIVNYQTKETAQCLENTKSNPRRTESTTSI